MAEFKLHHLTGQLLQMLGSNIEPQEFAELLQISITKKKAFKETEVPIQSIIEALAKHSPEPDLFRAKCEDLRDKNIDGLNGFAKQLYLISESDSVKRMLKKTVSKSGEQAAASKAAEFTTEDLPQVRKRLLKAVAGPEQHISSKSSVKTEGKRTILPDNVPSVTSWVLRRPSMSWDFPGAGSNTSISTLDMMPTLSQENALLEDLLNVLMGLDGVFVEAQPLLDTNGPREFALNSSIDPSLRELVKQILPLASHYSVVMRFIEEKVQFEFGPVNNALSSAMHKFVKDYYVFVCQLETEHRSNALSLQKMWFFIQKNLHTMGIMADIAMTISKANATGGKVLSLLHELTTSYIGDTRARELCLFLLQTAAVPYMNILELWIYYGVISDPMREFLVEDNEMIKKDEMPVDYSADYWEKRYTIRKERIPKFLEKVSDIILRAGKYLNVIRQCGKKINSKREHLSYTVDETQYVEIIEKAYQFASRTLLDLVLNENDLMGRLRSVKHYFLLDQGDFIVQCMNMCETELKKEVGDIIPRRLEALLELALRVSSANSDKYKDELRIELLQYDLQFQMFKILSIETDSERDFWDSKKEQMKLTGLESFSFGYEVRWPISLVLNSKAIACYQMLFRHLFYCKYVDRTICQVWKANMVAKAFPFGTASQYRAAFALRQGMLHCVQNLEYHMMVEVIEPNWNTFVHRMEQVTNVDEVLVCHLDFLEMCLKDCMLTSPALLKTITKLMAICMDFCSFIQANDLFAGSQDAAMATSGGPFQQSESFEQSIDRLNIEFSAVLVKLMDQIHNLGRDDNNDRLFNILYRMDFASYYGGQLEKLHKKGSSQETSG